MNEETIIEKRPNFNGQQETKKESNAWKQVTLGGVSGILLGAGLTYAGQALASTPLKESAPAEEDHQKMENEAIEDVRVAEVSDDMSFGEAFAAARAQVGAGGVFCWHGGVYGTYYADEWNAMTPEERLEYAERVQPEVQAHQVSTPTDTHPDVAVNHLSQENQEDVSIVNYIDEQQISDNFDMGEDVHIVGYTNAEGHLVVGYDTDNNGQADVAIIDMDDDFQPSDADVIMDREGNMATLGELNDEPDEYQQTSMENPDVAPDMPDYMNDAMMEA